MKTDGGGWTTFQRRMDGSVDFFLDWASYKKGFGNLRGEFWLGNDYLHRLTASANMVVRFDMEDYEDDRRYAEYTTFAVADESDDYRLTVGGYRGTAGDVAVSSNKPLKYVPSTECKIKRIPNDNYEFILSRDTGKCLPILPSQELMIKVFGNKNTKNSNKQTNKHKIEDKRGRGPY